MDYIEVNGPGNWRHLPKRAGLNRCGKSCRLRWTNYLRPDIKRGTFSEEDERLIIHLHSILGNKWSAIASRLPGRTDNEIKNYWNTHIRKKLLMMGIDPVTHRPRTDLNLLANLPNILAAAANFNNTTANPHYMMNAIDQLPQLQMLQNLIQSLTYASPNQLGSPYPIHDMNPANLGLNTLMNGDDAFEAMNYGIQSSCGGSMTTSFVSNNPTMNSTPSLVSSSPEYFSVDQSGANDSLNQMPMDDLDGDLSWKDILEQISWSNPLEQ